MNTIADKTDSMERLILAMVKVFMKGFLVSITVIVLLQLGFGCGVYTFNPKGKSSIQSLSIQRFENQTAEYGLADRMADQIIDAFIAEGTLKIVPVEGSEALLEGVLVGYERKPYTYNQNDEVQEYKVEMVFDITLKNPVDDSDIWKERMSQIGTYDVEKSETEETAQQRAIELLIEAIINKTTKSW